MVRQHFEFSNPPGTGADPIERPDALTESAGPICFRITHDSNGERQHDTAT